MRYVDDIRTERVGAIIFGDEDHCFIRGAKSIANKMKSSDIRIIKKCGHICSIENWKSFNSLALEYLSA